MWHDSFARRAVAGFLAVVLVLQVSGCSEWMAYQQPPAQVLTEKSPEKVRVKRVDGTQQEVYGPRIVNDTLVGYRSMSGDPTKPEGQVVSIAVADIESMEVHQSNVGGIAVLGILAGLLVVGLIVALPLTLMGDS